MGAPFGPDWQAGFWTGAFFVLGLIFSAYRVADCAVAAQDSIARQHAGECLGCTYPAAPQP